MLTAATALADEPTGGLRFGLSFPRERSDAALDGRMLLMLSTDDTKEPRFQIGGRVSVVLDGRSGPYPVKLALRPTPPLDR